jgi:c-di-GMP-binding flagellar brake protein YcgR
MGGLGMEVRAKNALNFSHEVGDRFHVDLTLPNGKKVSFKAEVRSVKKDRTLGTMFIGIEFFQVTEGDGKNLGFFMRA